MNKYTAHINLAVIDSRGIVSRLIDFTEINISHQTAHL